MSYKEREEKTKQSDHKKQEKNRKTKSDDQSVIGSNTAFSAGSLGYEDIIHNLKQLGEIERMKSDLADDENKESWDIFSLAFEKFRKEQEDISKVYDNQKEMEGKILNNNWFKLNNDLFETNMVKILSKTYGLKDYILYPYFRVEPSTKKNGNITKLYFIKIKFEIDENNVNTFAFLDDRENYMTYFQKIPMIFNKDKDSFTSVTVISKDFHSYINFNFEKKGQKYETSFSYNDINEELLEMGNKIKITKNAYDTINIKEVKKEEKKNEKENEKNLLKTKLELYDGLYKKLQTKYSSENLFREIETKKNELDILKGESDLYELEEKKDPKKAKEFEDKISNLKKEIEKYEMFLKKITIKIERLDQEFDGLFFTTSEISLTNTIGDTLKIPANLPIIVEVKNHNKYKSIIDNIIKKKKLLEYFGFNKFYFIGILNGIDVNESEKKEINQKKGNLSKIIIIYPEDRKFLNFPIYEEEKEKATEVKEMKNEQQNENEKDFNNNFIKLMEKIMEKGLKELENKISIDMNNIKNEIKELRGEIAEIKKKIN